MARGHILKGSGMLQEKKMQSAFKTTSFLHGIDCKRDLTSLMIIFAEIYFHIYIYM